MVLKYLKDRCLRSRFVKNQDGNIAVVFGLSATVIIGCMGAAMDFSTLSNAEARGQAIADQTALAAAVFVKTNGREPTPPLPVGEGETPEPEEGYLDDDYRTYTAAELGYEFKGWVEGGADNVTVSVNYDGTAKEAIVTVTGRTVPTFMQILGKKSMDFKSKATAKYEDYEFYDPASVLMVLDNSGSMAFDDKPLIEDENESDKTKWDAQPGAIPRLTALKNNAKEFMASLGNLVGDQTDNSDKVLRTGMLAYNTQTITSRTVQMDWQTDATEASIDRMVALGGTNSAPPVNLARTLMSTEDQTHINMHGEDPLKFLIFMTDGVNSTDQIVWEPKEDTGQWRGTIRTCWRSWWRRYCRTFIDTVESENEPNYGWNWEEGKWTNRDNFLTNTDCTAMKNDGVKIYTIGFALQAGWYDHNDYFSDDKPVKTSKSIRDQAYSFLSDCASEPATFLTAENSAELDQAFERIGNDIMTEIIRLSN